MATFSYTKKHRLSLGNRIGIVYSLANVQTTGSILYTPFKKVTGYQIETSSPTTSVITVASNTESRGGNGRSCAYLTFAADAESQGEILVWGLL